VFRFSLQLLYEAYLVIRRTERDNKNVLLLLLLLLTAVELSLGGSSPYTGTDKTDKNKYS